jgi:MFS family permease
VPHRRRILLDVRPLRESADFRRLWIGSGLSTVGSTMTGFAVVLQVYRLTGSSVAVGGVGLAMALPAVAFGLVGGSVADAVDRRRVVLLTSSCLALVSATFAWQSYAGMRSLWLLYGLVAVESTLVSVNSPARRTFTPRLLPPEQLAAGAALTMLAMHSAVIVGPALAGLVAGAWGLTVCYVVDAVSFIAALYATFRLPPMRPDTTTRPGARAIVEALRFVVADRVLLGAFLSDTCATVLGMPLAIFPAINAQRFGGAPQTLGLFTAAVAVGGVIGTALSGPVGQVRRTGRAMLVAAAVWGGALAGFGFAHRLWLALAMLALAGTADVISVVFRSATVQLLTPDRQRGRVAAVEYVVGAGLPQLGNFRAGTVASLTSPGFSAVSGGLSVIAASGLLALTLPAFVRYRAPVTRQPAEQSSS